MKTIKIRHALALAACLAAGSAMAQNVPAASAQSDNRGLTRAEVQADLELWKRAGLDEFWRGDATPDIYSAEYRAAYQNYQQMRQGAEYQEAVRQRSGQ